MSKAVNVGLTPQGLFDLLSNHPDVPFVMHTEGTATAMDRRVILTNEDITIQLLVDNHYGVYEASLTVRPEPETGRDHVAGDAP